MTPVQHVLYIYHCASSTEANCSFQCVLLWEFDALSSETGHSTRHKERVKLDLSIKNTVNGIFRKTAFQMQMKLLYSDTNLNICFIQNNVHKRKKRL